MDISTPARYIRFEGGLSQPVEGAVVREGLVRIHVNGCLWVTLMCSPVQLDQLALGLLAGEGVIRSRGDVRRVVVCPSATCVEVWLHDANVALPTQAIRTSGCGGGVTFHDLTEGVAPICSERLVTPGQLTRLMRALLDTQETRGVHTAALADGERLLHVVEDVGRHNTIDKLWGYCLSEGVPTQDRILLSTGRISSEMLGKAARMGVPVVVSRTSPTSLSVALANAWNVTLVGYLRRDSLNVYSGPQRVVADQEEQADAHS